MASGVRAGEVLAILRAQNEMAPAIREAQEQMRGLGGHIANAASTMAGFVGGTAIMGAVSSAFSVAKNAAFGMNSTLETTTLQFHSLGMTTDEAKKHVADLFQFAKETPFETGPIIEASRQLRVFGGANLDTVANLRLFGDTAAATNADLGALTFWFGRLYSAAQAGKPFGEALQNLQQLGVLSPQAITQLSNMSEKGAKFADVWKVATGDLQRFNGAMKDQAGTWKGLTSTISDAINITGAQVLQPFFKMAEQGAGRLADALSSPSVAQAAQQLSGQLGSMLAQATREGGTAISQFQAVMRTTGDPIAAVDTVLVHLASSLGLPQPLILGLNSVLLTAAETLRTVGGVVRDILIAAVERLGPPLSHLGSVVLSDVLPPLDTLITKVAGWVSGADDAGKGTDGLAQAVNSLAGPLQAVGDVIKALADHFDQVKVALTAAVIVWTGWQAVMIVTTAYAWLQTAGIYAYVIATYAMRAATIVATVAQWAWNVAMAANPIGLVIIGIALLVGGIVLLVTHWNQVTAAVQGAWQWFVNIYNSTGPLSSALHLLVGPLVELIQHWGDLTSAIGQAWSAIQRFAGSLSSIHIPTPHFNVDWTHIGVGDVGVDIPSISFGGWYQQGAIFTRPTLIGVGEGGVPEGVFPLPRGYNPAAGAAAMGLGGAGADEEGVDHLLGPPSGGRRRGMTVVNHNTFNITGQDPEATWRMIERRLGTLFLP